MSRQRRKFSAEQKTDAVRRHLWDKVAVSELAEELEVQPTQIHQWIQQVRLQMHSLFHRPPARPESQSAYTKDQEIAKLKAARRLDRKPIVPSKKGTGFVQPEKPHKHWHVDVSYLNLGVTFYFLISVLDGMSRYIVHWEISPTMKELDIEIVIQRALEKYPDARPRIISDNGPQFIAKDFKEFIRVAGLTHVRTSPYYPQSNGKLERWHGVLKPECIRPSSPDTLEQAVKNVTDFVHHYNTVRLHSAIGYITPMDCLNGLGKVIGDERDRKLASKALNSSHDRRTS